MNSEVIVTTAQNHNFSKMILCGFRKQLTQIVDRDRMLSHDIVHDLVTIRILVDDILKKWDDQEAMEVTHGNSC